jgi:hypothetical protein
MEGEGVQLDARGTMQKKPAIVIPADVALKLGCYVYVLVNPLDGKIFYVGKGKGRRALAHFQDTRRSRETETLRQKTLRQISAAELTHRIDILVHGLKDEETAFRIEAGVIDALGLPALTNEIRGWETKKFGRLPLTDIVALYRKKKVTIKEPGIIIRINRLYRAGMSATELYDATRGVWVIGPRREKAKYAFAVFAGVIKDVPEIDEIVLHSGTASARTLSRRNGLRPSSVTTSTRRPRAASTSSQKPIRSKNPRPFSR